MSRALSLCTYRWWDGTARRQRSAPKGSGRTPAIRQFICHAGQMGTIIVVLLIVWLVLAVLGAILEGLFWLTVVAIVLLIGTGIYGWVKRKASNV